MLLQLLAVFIITYKYSLVFVLSMAAGVALNYNMAFTNSSHSCSSEYPGIRLPAFVYQ